MKTTPKKAANSKPSPFDHLVAAMAALYEEELLRLVDQLRPRILAGEFSDVPGKDDGPRWQVLGDHLMRTHPWLATERGRQVTEAVTHWHERPTKAATNPKDGSVLGWGGEDNPGDNAGEWMAHDILWVAAARGWVKRMRYINDSDTYALRVA